MILEPSLLPDFQLLLILSSYINFITMSILPSNVDKKSHAISLVIVFRAHGEGVVASIEDEALPLV